MTYLHSFTLPTLEQEAKELYCNVYPFGIFPFKQLHHLTFSEITLFYGGNGSGKTTLLNLIAEHLHLPRITPFNRSEKFDYYARSKCVHESSGGKIKNTVPEKSAIFTSDDVFHEIIERRVYNEDVMPKRQQKQMEHSAIKGHGGNLSFAPSDNLLDPENYRTLTEYIDITHMTQTQYVDKYAGIVRTPDSNGQYAMNFFRTHLKENCLYLLDEPENSLSPRYQLELIEFLMECARFYNCQFVISTHSPFVMSMRGALIYDLDNIPVETKPWYELENMKLYYQFFKLHRKKFE